MRVVTWGIATPALVFFVLFAIVRAWAETVEYDLEISEREVSITGRPSSGMVINGGIPGPTLRFTEGDTARIRVRNRMGVDTSIHWHGILVPPDMDGVPYLSFPPIKPGATFIYEFPIRQNGTYWYHTHTGLQEQSGLYGAIVIQPKGGGRVADRDHVVLFSDWTDEDPGEVMRTLKRGSDWYAIKKGNAQSLLGAARLGMLGGWFARELQRMPPMDISDVAYDRFLANGEPETTFSAGPGETVRIRIIDGSSTTYFHLEYAGGPMTVVSADGQDVEPVEETRLLIGVAETYDVLVRVPSSGAYELRATAHDGSGHASVWIGSGERHPAPDVPRPNLYYSMGAPGLGRILALTPAGAMGMSDRDVEEGRFDRPGMADMDSMAMHSMPMGGMEGMEGMEHAGHSMPSMPPSSARAVKGRGIGSWLLAGDVSSSEALAVDGMDPARPWPPYARLRAVRPTSFPAEKTVREVRLTLDGDMERYVWSLDNRPLSESDEILVREGEVTRFIMINRTMMHHPMHLHGHFFRVVNGQGDRAPLKHTVDVAPMSTTVIEFDASEPGDWFFHCHLLYHMESGMARVVHYEGFTPAPGLSAIRHRLAMDHWHFWGQAEVLTQMTEGFLTFSGTRNILTAEWEAGWQDWDGSEWEGVFTLDRYINGFSRIFAGLDLMGEGDESEECRGVFGLRYLLPLNVESRVWIDTDGGARLNLGKSIDLAPRLALFGHAEYDSREKWEGSAGLSYMIRKDLSFVGKWHSDYGMGGGIEIRF